MVSKRKRRILVAAGIALVLAASLSIALIVRAGRGGHDIYVLFVYRRVQSSAMHSEIGWEFPADDPRERIASFVALLLEDAGVTAAKNSGDDTSVGAMWLQLDRVKFKAHLERFENVFRKSLGSPPVSPFERAQIRNLITSQEVYVRITPEGNYYVSSAGDRAHKLHEGDIPPGEGMEQKIADILCAHWKDWIAQAERITRDNPLDGQRD